MTVSRATLIQRGARRIGGRTGNISSGTGTTVVLAGLVNTTGDNNAYAGDRLMMLEAATEADKERLIDSWVDLTGTATYATRSDTTYTSETYVLSKRPDYTLAEYRSALQKALSYTRRSYRHVIPIAPNQTTVPLLSMDWLEGAGDVDSVFLGDSPVMLHNEDMGLWTAGGSLAPDGWTLAGSNATVARSATGIRSAYGATVTRVGADATLYQSVPAALLQWMTRRTGVQLLPWLGGAWVTTGTASVARVGIYNGATTSWSSYHTGSGSLQWLTASYTPTATDTDCRLVLSVDTTNAAATFHAGALMSAVSLPSQARDMGSQAYREHEMNFQPRNLGGVPSVELDYADSGQLIVYSRRPFADMSADTDVCEDQHARALEAGMLRFLLEENKPNQDRARLDRVMLEEARIWTRFTTNFTDRPVPKPLGQVMIVGA